MNNASIAMALLSDAHILYPLSITTSTKLLCAVMALFISINLPFSGNVNVNIFSCFVLHLNACMRAVEEGREGSSVYSG